MIFAFAAVRGLMQLFAPDKSKTPPSILSNMLPATFPEHLLFTLTRDVQKKQSNTLPPGLPQHPGKWRMLQKGMPILPSGREDQESKDRQQRGGERHASHRGRTGKGLEERRHMSGNKSFDLVQQGPCEGPSRRDEAGPGDCS